MGLIYILTMNKRGFFFTVDVTIAMIIIVIGFMLIWSFYVTEGKKEQPYFYAQDAMDFLSYSTVGSVSGPIDYILRLISDGNITNMDNTLLEQITLSYINDNDKAPQPCEGESCKTNVSSRMLESVFTQVIPEQYGIRFILNGTDLYLKNSTTGKGENTSDILISAKKIAVVVFNKFNLSDPYVAEVRVWR